jgi:hypothetical protein
MFKRMKKYWCRFAHKRTSWPIHEHYECFQCGTVFPVQWDESQERSTREEDIADGDQVGLPGTAYSAEGTAR